MVEAWFVEGVSNLTLDSTATMNRPDDRIIVVGLIPVQRQSRFPLNGCSAPGGLEGLNVISGAVQIIAHRGSSRSAPENTMPAFRLAWEEGADGVELDLRLTRDGEIVALHDATLNRTTAVARRTDELSLQQLRELDAGRWKDPRWAGTPVPTLIEVLREVPDGGHLFAELKCGPEVIDPLREIISATESPEELFTFMSFEQGMLEAVKAAFPGIRSLLAIDLGRWLPFRQPDTVWEQRIDQVRAIGLDGFNLGLRAAMPLSFLHRIKKRRLAVFAWTVNNARLARRLQRLGIDGIMTDRPGWLRMKIEGVN